MSFCSASPGSRTTSPLSQPGRGFDVATYVLLLSAGSMMWFSVFLGGVLALGQATPPAEKAVAPTPPPPPPDRWPLMLGLQGTYPGWLLDGNKLQLYGWVDSAFTASSAAHDQLPMGFNYRSNEAHVQQAWVR